MTNYYVYEHWRLDRDECFYVGMGHGLRAFVMKKRGNMHRAIQQKLSREGSGMEVRMVKTGLTEEEAILLEQERIAFWKDKGIDLANITYTGIPAHNAKSVLCLETLVLYPSMRAAAIAMDMDQVSILDACRRKTRFSRGFHFVFADGMLSREQADAEIRSIEMFCAARRKKSVAIKHQDRGIIDGRDAKGRSAAGPMSRARPVICLEDKRTFPSATSAARHYNIPRSAIIELCLGKNNRKSAGGLRFAYLQGELNGVR
jgi:hypothetical protein